MSRSDPPWSPYGLETHRVALLRQRARLLAAGIVLGMLLLGAILALSITQQNTVDPFGGQGSTVGIDLNTEATRAKPTTLTVAPGRTTVLDQPIQPEARPQRTGEPPPQVEKGRFNWLALLQGLAPPIGIALYAWRLGKKRVLGPLEQVNLGVYKGAMPLELHTAEHRGFVFTKRLARASLFGKAPEDHLPARPVVLARRRA